MEHLPAYIYWVFGITVMLAILIFYPAINRSKYFPVIIAAWLLVQTITGLSGFYEDTDAIPPKFALLVLPPLILIIRMFVTAKGKSFVDSLDIKTLTLFHIIRVPVEIVLFWLYTYKAIPESMTFEGRNFDIFSGLTAPVIYYFSFVKPILSRKYLVTWNMICLALLLNIVVNAILSAPTPFQQFAFDQPNIAILHFPFIFLPGLLVPMVLFSHLAAIKLLMVKK